MLKIEGQKKDPTIPPFSAYGMFLFSSANHWGDVVADENDMRVTRAEMREDIDLLANLLKRFGTREGDIITVASGRSMYATVAIFLAANKLGAITAILDERVPRDILVNYLDEFGSRIVFVYGWSGQEILELKRKGAFVKYVINMREPHSHQDFPDSFLVNNKPGGTLSRFREIYQLDDRSHLGHLFGAHREALISFTSGSTSGPKPMVFTNQNLLAEAIYGKAAAGVEMWDKRLHSWMPYVHFDCPYGFVVSTLAPLFGGGEIIFTPDIYQDRQKINYYLRKNPNVIFGVPKLLEEIPKVLEDDVSLSNLRLFTSGGERLEAEISRNAVKFFEERGLQVHMANGYGVGEALGLISTAIGGAVYNPNTVGVVPAGVHVMVCDPETGEELGFEEPGIICVTGKQILKRYYNRPQLDREEIITRNGVRFVKTGDLGYVTRDGYIVLTGRADFFLNNQSVKVYYEVVREAISQSRLVRKCFVVKGPDRKLGLAAYAFVIRDDLSLTEEQTRRAIMQTVSDPFYLGERLTTLEECARPRKIIFVDDFPMTPANKVDFHRLEEMAREIGAEEVIQE